MVGCVQRRPGKPPCLVIRGQLFHEDGKPVFAPYPRGSQQLLHQLEHGHDVPPLLFSFRRQKFCQQEHHGSQQALRRIVKVGVLPVVSIAVRRYDGLGQYLGVFLRLGAGSKAAGGLRRIHVVVNERHEVVAI